MDTIWVRLDHKNGGKCKLVDKIMSDIKSMSVCHDSNSRDSDSSKILEFIKTVENADIRLASYGKEG